MRFSVTLVEEDDEDQVRAIVGPDAKLEREGIILSGNVTEEQVAAFARNGLIVTVLPDPPGGETFAKSADARLNPLADYAEAATGVDMPPPGTFATASIAGPLTEERRRWMVANGIEVCSRLETSRYVVRIDWDRWDGVGPAWLSTGEYGLAETVGYTVIEREIEGLSPDGVVFEGNAVDFPLSDDFGESPSLTPDAAFTTFEARCHAPHRPGELQGILQEDPRVRETIVGEARVRVTVDDPEGTFLRDLAGLEIVEQAEPYVPFSLELTYAVEVLTGGRPRPTSMKWKGAGEMIAIADSGIDEQHPDFAGRLTVRRFAEPPSDRDPHGHGTHVASIAAGSGAGSNGELAGIAPEASIYLQSLMGPDWNLSTGNDGVRTLSQDAYAAGARIQNFSFGATVQGRYTIDAQELDRFVHEHEDMLIVVACGNDGREDSATVAKRAALASVASPASAKNCLTVGASGTPRTDGPYAAQQWSAYDGKHPPQFPPMSTDQIVGTAEIVAPLSSRGPTREGRLKPDLVAPGVCIAAARSADSAPNHPVPGFDDLYCYRTGTSMAAPLVAGAAAVLRQFLREERGHLASAALLKACLINSTLWLAGAPWEDPDIGEPNFHQGFGLMSLARTIPVDGSAFSLLFDDIRNADPQALIPSGNPRWSRTISVGVNQPLSCTLAWTDPGARGLQSDLDLVLIDPGGKRYLGNAGLRRAPYEERDTRNNVKRILIPAPPASGGWRVMVLCNDGQLPQGFALAMTGDIAEP